MMRFESSRNFYYFFGAQYFISDGVQGHRLLAEPTVSSITDEATAVRPEALSVSSDFSVAQLKPGSSPIWECHGRQQSSRVVHAGDIARLYHKDIGEANTVHFIFTVLECPP